MTLSFRLFGVEESASSIRACLFTTNSITTRKAAFTYAAPLQTGAIRFIAVGGVRQPPTHGSPRIRLLTDKSSDRVAWISREIC